MEEKYQKALEKTLYISTLCTIYCVIYVYCIILCYWPPTRRSIDYELFVDFLRRAEGPAIVVRYFNAKYPEWGDTREENGCHQFDSV